MTVKRNWTSTLIVGFTALFAVATNYADTPPSDEQIRSQIERELRKDEALQNVTGHAAGDGGFHRSSVQLVEEFRGDWKDRWMERRLSRRSTNYKVVSEDGNLVLKAESAKSASTLWRMLRLQPVHAGVVSWRWKVARSLSENTKERTKSGDDYAARLLLIFDPDLFSWRTRAICYVWAGNEAVGSVYRSPYASSVATVVVESGDEHSGQWITEQRDFVADFRSIFGQTPEMVTAIAIMVDTDNTDSRATAWFDDIVIAAGRSDVSPFVP